MKINTLCLLLLTVALPTLTMEAQSCRDLYRQAVAMQKEGKLDKAKELFTQVIACGDNLYIDDSRSNIAWIDRLQRKYSPVKPFAVSDNEVIIPCQGGQDVITVDGNGNWQAKIVDGDNGWCNIRKEKGKILIYSEPNEDCTPRTCVVEVTMAGKSKKVKITNQQAPEKLEPSAKSISFPSEGETHSIQIEANTDWVVKDVPGWVVSSREAGNITLTALANENNVERQADIKIEGESKSVVINIYQGAGLDHLVFSKNDLHFGPDGGDEYINVYTDAAQWQLGGFPHWCQVTKVADNLLKVHCTPNEPNDLSREASVNVTTGRQMLGINVCQDAKPMVHIIPQDGIGGRRISFGFAAGYVMPMISATSSSPYTFSAVNYAMSNQKEQAAYRSGGGFDIAAVVDIRLYKNLYLTPGVEYLFYKYNNELSGNALIQLPQSQATAIMKGEAAYSFKEEYSMSDLHIPVLVSYRIPLTKRSHIRLNAGPVLGIGLASRLKFSGNTNSEKMQSFPIVNGTVGNTPAPGYWASHINYSGSFNLYSDAASYTVQTSDGVNPATYRSSKFDSSPLNRINCGLRFGVGYEYMGISLNVSYQWMISNIASGKYWSGDRWTVFQHAGELMTGYSQHNNLLLVTVGYTFRY